MRVRLFMVIVVVMVFLGAGTGVAAPVNRIPNSFVDKIKQ